ncbi:hypothetical protein [Spiroplasma sp. DGKH1]|uniref:hypothetical protein n=1 Tax=Spiroplasma sp. DGKH1 TaxID=3050074 RepID=UPI0034C5EDF1
MDWSIEKVKNFMKKWNIKIKNKDLWIEACTTSGYVNENKDSISYERLEFLGDRVWNLIIADTL